MKRETIWTREFTAHKLEQFQEDMLRYRGRIAIGEWHDMAGMPRDSLNHDSKKYGMNERYREAVQLIRKANRKRRW